MDRFANNDLDPLNPYAAPAAPTVSADTPQHYEMIRHEHLNHETNVRSFGTLYYIGSVGLTLGGAACLGTGVIQLTEGDSDAVILVSLGIVYLVLGIFQFFVAGGLRKFAPIGRIGGTIFGVLGLIGFPVGTMISAYFLYLLWSEKGEMVFSDEYKRVLQATPHIVYKTSIIVKIFVVLLLVVFALAFLAAVVGIFSA